MPRSTTVSEAALAVLVEHGVDVSGVIKEWLRDPSEALFVTLGDRVVVLCFRDGDSARVMTLEEVRRASGGSL